MRSRERKRTVEEWHSKGTAINLELSEIQVQEDLHKDVLFNRQGSARSVTSNDVARACVEFKKERAY